MCARFSSKLDFDTDWADGSLETLELTYESVIAYHGGWNALHPEDQREFLASCANSSEPLQLLISWQKADLLDPEQLLRLAEIQARQPYVESLIRSLSAPLSIPARTTSHPMVLDD